MFLLIIMNINKYIIVYYIFIFKVDTGYYPKGTPLKPVLFYVGKNVLF